MTEDEEVEFEKTIFQIFRKINILEYRNPHDSLNERMLHKACGYAGLYIAAAEHEGDRPAEQVTISIFRAVKNPELFEKMEQEGTLVKGDTMGVYYVKGMTSLPFQIVITSELRGEEYFAFRVPDGSCGGERC